MSVTFVAVLATFLLFATSNAGTPSYEDRHLVRERPPASRNLLTYRLPVTTRPSNYKVLLRIDPDYHESFSGNVEIDITAISNTREIILHAHTDMVVGNITVIKTGSGNIFSSFQRNNTDNHFLNIFLNNELSIGDEAKLRIEFVGKYGDEEGLYLSSYKNQENITTYLATTQFQAVSAREAFPCYDEPHLKARFTMTIYNPKKFHAISNMEEDTLSGPSDIDNFKGTEFRTTPLMSTYLIAFIVSDFISKSNDENQIFPRKKFHVFARPTAADSLDYPLDFAQRSLLDLEKYTNLPYILPKMDKAAVPDFSAGAMENWGLVTYREEYLLHKNGTTSTADEQFIAAVISHENAHMWFGNEVTPLWWSFLWLSEGFATYFEYYTTDSVLNFQFRMMEQFVVTYMQGVMRSDATTSTNAMTNNVASPSEIDNNFNGIAYDKSGSVIRMIQHIMGKEAFQLGLQNYVKNLTLEVTEPIKLFTQLEAVANSMPLNIKLTDVFHSWSSQKGFPMVSALHMNDRRYVEFYQTRYYQQPRLNSNEQWYIPLTWALKGNANFENTTAQNWLEPGSNLTIDLNEAQQWFIVNKQQMGYFRVMYDKANWISLSEALHKEDFDGIHHLNRAQLIDDAYAFATSLRLSFNVTMDLLSYLTNEDDFIPWITAERLINNMDILMQASGNNDRFKRFTTSLSKNTYDKFGIDAKSEDSSIDKLHREIALSLQCNAGISNARGLANNQIAQIVTDPDFKIDPDLRSTIYCCGLRSSSEEEWDAIFEKYIEATRPTEKYMVLRTLGCTEDKLIADRYLNMSISEDSRVDDEDRFRVVVAVINGGGMGLTYAMDFLFDEFPKFQSMTADVSGGLRVISALQNRVVAGWHVTQFFAFREKYDSIFTDSEKSAIARAIDAMSDRNLWLYTALREIDPWLIDNVPNASGTLASVSKLLITICAMFLIYLY